MATGSPALSKHLITVCLSVMMIFSVKAIAFLDDVNCYLDPLTNLEMVCNAAQMEF